jgi:sec-independent protein translocase protein TatC
MSTSTPLRPDGGPGSALRRRSRRGNPDGSMTLVEHLYELRYRVGLAILAALVGALIGFLWWQYTIRPIPSLGDLLIKPYCALPAGDRLSFQGRSCALLQTQPFDAFMTRIKVGIAAGLVLSSPAWFYQLWAFITPALRRNERRFALIFVAAASILFATGATLAYLVVPAALRVLSEAGGGQFVIALAGSDYVSFMLALLVIFGTSFELPLLVVMLNQVGVLKYDRLRTWRRGIILGLFVFAAVVTPGQDPISMCVLAGTLTLLFEVAVQIARLHDRRVANRNAMDWERLADDEPSPLPVRSDDSYDIT